MKPMCSFVVGQPFARLGNLAMHLCGVILLTVLFAPADVRASDPVGIYAYVDRVVLEPSDTAPERIQVWGGFALAKDTPTRMEYHNAEAGYLYFKLRPGDEEICKKEWADLKSVAGKQQIVAFGSRDTNPPPTIRKTSAKPENPDVYPKGWGMTKVDRGQTWSRAPIKQLSDMAGRPAGAGNAPPATPLPPCAPATPKRN
jgi:hypothetical protein